MSNTVQIHSTTLKNCIKLKNIFDHLRIKHEYEEYNRIKYITPKHCIYETSCTIITKSSDLDEKTDIFLKKLEKKNKIRIT
jgi:hypothetical protein